MSNIIRLKRRAAGGAAGAPATLKTSEVAYNETDNVLYIGFGDDGNGNATTIIALAGEGLFATKAYVNDAVGNAGGGDMLQSVYDADNDGKVDSAASADTVPWGGISEKPSTFPPAAHNHDDRYYTETEMDGFLDAKAPINNPQFTGNPTAPTQTQGNNTTRLATTAFVQAELERLIGTAPGTLDTLQEIAEALGEDPNFAATIANQLATKLNAASNLSDLADAAASRGNLGLGTLATQNAADVDITGGSVDGVTITNSTIDGGTF